MALPEPTREVSVLRMNDALVQTDCIAAEVPVALVFNGISHAVMMATPADLEAFAMGFALSEGLLASRDECRSIEVIATGNVSVTTDQANTDIALSWPDIKALPRNYRLTLTDSVTGQ